MPSQHNKVLRPLLFSLLPCLLLLLPGCRSGAFPQYPANYREYAYVANNGSNTVTILDLVAMRQQAVLPVGLHPVALAVSPVRNEVYVISQGASGNRGLLSIIGAETNTVLATLPLGRMPADIAIDASGERLYIANGGANSVSVIDTIQRRVVGVVGVGESPTELAVSPDGTTLAVTNRASNSVSLMEIPSHSKGDLTPATLPKLRASFDGCPGAGSLAILPDSSKAFVACAAGHQVLALSLRTSPSLAHRSRNSVAAEPDQLLALLDVGISPVRLVLKPDGGEIFVTNEGSNTVSEIATGTNEVGGASLIGSSPVAGVVSADNSLLWVSNRSADTVAVYSVDDGKLINTVHTGSGPGPVILSADGHLLLAADTRSGDISVVRTFSRNLRREPVYGTLFTLLPAGNSPSAIVEKAFRLKH